MIDIEKLKQAALAATQGEWVASDHVYAADGKHVASYHTLTRDDVDNYNNATHIATANPAAVLELINLQEAAESQLASQELVIQQLRDALDELANLMEGVYIGAYHPDSFTNQPAKSILAIPASTKPLEAWYKEQVGEPVAYMQISVEEGVDTKFPRDHLPKKYNKEWWKFEPLHAIKPFPFKEK